MVRLFSNQVFLLEGIIHCPPQQALITNLVIELRVSRRDESAPTRPSSLTVYYAPRRGA